jgi:predicted molibdopterin-dependent oxidoreductase YjgC
MISLTIDDRTIQVKDGTTILEAAKMFDIPIPTLCYHPKLKPFGGCRLCIVEIQGFPRPVTSCTTPATDGMVVSTSTPQLEKLRKTNLELILSDHPGDCMICEKSGNCELQELAYFYGLRENRFEGERRIYTTKDSNPFIQRDMEKCILCSRCVKVCTEIQGAEAIDFAYRGFKSKICPPYEKDLNCEFCGQCVAICPTGALTGRLWTSKGRQKDIKEVDTVCGYCGTGCNITLHVMRNTIIRVTSKEDTWNEGWLCAKGRFGYEFVNSDDRLKYPFIKRNNKFERASWQEAFDYIALRMNQIKSKYGADAIGGLSSARCTTEENYAFQKFMRAAIGTNNVDHCARL